MSRSSPDREDGEAWLEKEGSDALLEDSEVSSCRSHMCCSVALPLWELDFLPPAARTYSWRPNLTLAHPCPDARKSLLWPPTLGQLCS